MSVPEEEAYGLYHAMLWVKKNMLKNCIRHKVFFFQTPLLSFLWGKLMEQLIAEWLHTRLILKCLRLYEVVFMMLLLMKWHKFVYSKNKRKFGHKLNTEIAGWMLEYMKKACLQPSETNSDRRV